MRLSLRAGEKIYMNGAVFSVDRKVSIELLNDATFLLEAHVMQAEEATSPLRQIYFGIQMMLMEPAESGTMRAIVEQMFLKYLAQDGAGRLGDDARAAREAFGKGRLIDALKALRRLFPRESLIAEGAAGDETEGELRCR